MTVRDLPEEGQRNLAAGAVPALLTWQSWALPIWYCSYSGRWPSWASFNIRAYSPAKVGVVVPLSYASLLFAALIGWLFFNEIPSAGVVLGAWLIAIGGAAIILSQR